MDVDDIPLDIIHDSPSKSDLLSYSNVKSINSKCNTLKCDCSQVYNDDVQSDTKSDATSDDSTIGTELGTTSSSHKLNSSPLVMHVQPAPNLYFNPLSDTE